MADPLLTVLEAALADATTNEKRAELHSAIAERHREKGDVERAQHHQKQAEQLRQPVKVEIKIDEPRGPLRVIARGGELVDGVEKPEVTFADVGGMQDVKKTLDRGFLAPMKNPERHKKYGRTIKGGFVLYGPPGCGKTYIARALAGEIGA